MTFSEILNDLLLEKGKSKMDLSREADIPYTTICGWISAGRLPDYNAIKKLAKYFDVQTDYILNLDNENNIAQEETMPHDEKELLRTYRQMSAGKKKALFSMLDIDENVMTKNKTES